MRFFNDAAAKNPNRKEDLAHKPPEKLVKEIEEKERKIEKILTEIKKSL